MVRTRSVAGRQKRALRENNLGESLQALWRRFTDANDRMAELMATSVDQSAVSIRLVDRDLNAAFDALLQAEFDNPQQNLNRIELLLTQVPHSQEGSTVQQRLIDRISEDVQRVRAHLTTHQKVVPGSHNEVKLKPAARQS